MKKQMILLLLFLLLSLTAFCAHAEIMDCFPKEKAANSAYHLFDMRLPLKMDQSPPMFRFILRFHPTPAFRLAIWETAHSTTISPFLTGIPFPVIPHHQMTSSSPRVI